MVLKTLLIPRAIGQPYLHWFWDLSGVVPECLSIANSAGVITVPSLMSSPMYFKVRQLIIASMSVHPVY